MRFFSFGAVRLEDGLFPVVAAIVLAVVLIMATIRMFVALKRTTSNYRDTSFIIRRCVLTLFIAYISSFLIGFLFTDLFLYQHEWIGLVLSILIGLSVFVFMYRSLVSAVEEEKIFNEQDAKAHLEFLRNKLNSIYGGTSLSFLAMIVSGIILAIIFTIFPESESTWILLPGFIFLGSFPLLVLYSFLPSLFEKRVADAEHEFQKSEITAEQERQSSENVQNKKFFSLAADYLEKNPETSHNNWRSIIPEGDASHMKMGAKIAMRRFLDQRKFEQGRSLLNYYDADEFNLLPVMEALNHQAQTGALDLSPRTFKLTLEKNETAYEKLPCNWQKIHTYLAPLTDEHEQADILDSGNIYITDQRVFFVGKKGSETVYLNDIAYMDHKEDALQFFRDEGLSEIFAFPTPHHATYARLVIEELLSR